MNRIRNDESLELHNCVDTSMDRLTVVWDEIGIIGETRDARRAVVLLHVMNLLDEMVHEEEILKEKLLENVEKFSMELVHISEELGLTVYKPPEGLSVLQLEKDLRSRVDGLMKEKQDRMKRLKKLIKTDEQLCNQLALTPYHILSSVVPSKEQLAELEEHVQGLELEQVRRQKQFISTQEKIVRMLEDLELSPNTSFERNVVCESDTVRLTMDNLKAAKRYHEELKQLVVENKATAAELWTKVKSLWERLQLPQSERDEFETQNTGCSHRTIQSLRDEQARCDVLKLQNMKQIIEATRRELVQLWDKCYILQEQRQAFTPFFDDVMSEELLTLHEKEVERMTEYYVDNQEMLEMVSKRQQLWSEFLELEQRASKPDRFLNRGCNLLKEEKQRRKIAVELPKVEQEVLIQIHKWEKETGRQFNMGGMPFDEFVRRQHEEYTVGKENEKMQRQQLKAKQMEEEIMFGSKPATPGTKRFAGTTPTKTPNKRRKIDNTPTKATSTKKSKKHFFSPVPGLQRPREKETAKVETKCGLSERNRATSCQTLSSSNAPSTTVVAPAGGFTSSEHDTNSLSLFSVGAYDEFENGLNRASNCNVRSTIVPKGAYF